jgi:flagellar protein FlaJ
MLADTFRRLESIVPAGIVKLIEKKLKFAGIQKEPLEWIGETVLLASLYSIIFVLIYFNFFGRAIDAGVFIFFISFVLICFISYAQLFFAAYERTNAVETYLPDFLSLIVSNIRAGMQPSLAFIHAARPEFGPLYEAVKIASTKVGGKASLTDALDEVSTYFDSPTFKKIVIIFAKGAKAGGNIAKLVERSADEIRKIHDLRNELISSTRAYMIFLLFIIVIVMPFLFAVSTNFLSTFVTIQSQAPTYAREGSTIPIFSGNVLITPNDMANISIIMLVITSFFVSIVMGVIRTGMPFYGMKYFPLVAIASVGFFIGMRSLISMMITAAIGA